VSYEDTQRFYTCRYPKGWTVRYEDVGEYWRTMFLAPGDEVFGVKVRKTALPAMPGSSSRRVEEQFLRGPLRTKATDHLIDHILYDTQVNLAGHCARAYGAVGKIDGKSRRQFFVQLLYENRPFLLQMNFAETQDQDVLKNKEAMFSEFTRRFELSAGAGKRPEDSRAGDKAEGAYVDRKGRFQIVPPRGWRLQDFPSDPRSRAIWHCPNSKAVVGVIVKPSEVPLRTLEDLMENLRALERKMGTKMNIERVTTPSGLAAKRSFTYRGTQCIMLDYLDGQMTHNAMYAAPPSEFNAHLKEGDESLRTYQVVLRKPGEEQREEQLAVSLRRQVEVHTAQGDLRSAGEALEKGLRHAPGDPGLLSLKDRLDKQLSGDSDVSNHFRGWLNAMPSAEREGAVKIFGKTAADYESVADDAIKLLFKNYNEARKRAGMLTLPDTMKPTLRGLVEEWATAQGTR
jgi:hypothetical protein